MESVISDILQYLTCPKYHMLQSKLPGDIEKDHRHEEPAQCFIFPTLVIASSRSETEKREDAFPASAGALPSSCCFTGIFLIAAACNKTQNSTQIKEASEYQKFSIGRVASSHQNPADHRCKNANHKHELIPKGIDIVSLPQ